MEFFHTAIDPSAIDRVAEVLRSERLSEGRLVLEFEEGLSQKLGLANPVALNSGTSALHLALVVAGVGAGDEVILPAQTFVASGHAILMQQAVPIFADINPRTGNICPESVERKLTSRTKAIMPVHWAGYPCDLEELNDLATEHGLAVVEDAAHALGARYRDKPIGSISRFTAFSFQAIKHLTTGDGGALCCPERADELEVRAKRWFGIDRANSKPSILGEREYDISALGYKYHLNDYGAALGLANLESFHRRLERHQEIGARYRRELADISGLHLLECKPDRTHSYWLFTLLVDRREAFIRALQSQGVPTSVVHLRIDRNTVFGGVRKDLIGQQEFNEKQVSLPVHVGLTDADVAHIVETIKAGW